MKQPLLLSLLLSASALVVTGCATKQDSAARRAQQEATEMTYPESAEMAPEATIEPMPEATPEPVADPAPAAPAEAAPAQTEAPAPAPQVQAPVRPQPVPYVVTAGDSISALAVRFNVRQPDILALNPSLRKNPGSLRIGQTVMFPAGTDVTVKPKPRKVVKAPAKGAYVYTVKSGDVLGGIAARHGVSVQSIKDANGLKKDFIIVGQKLAIPGAKKPAKKAEPKPAEKPAEKPVEKAPEAKPVVEEPLPTPEVVEPPKVEEPEPVVEAEQQGEEALPPPPPEPAAEATPQPAQTRAYVVAEGEDLVAVSLRWGVPLPALRAANGIDEAAGNAIAAGTTLQIPVPAAN